MGKVSSAVEELPWVRAHSLAFLTFSLGAAIEAYIYSIAYIATGWVRVPREFTALLSVWPPLWLLVGGAVMGPVADMVGRKRSLYLTLTMYVVGALGLVLSHDYSSLLVFLGMLLLATGGEYNIIMAASHEYFPRRYRSRAVFLILNFTNAGGALASLLAVMNVSSPSLQRIAIGATILAAAPMLYILRMKLPESIHWLESKGKVHDAINEATRHYGKVAPGGRSVAGIELPSSLTRSVIGALLGWSYTAGITLMALTLGPYFMPSLTNWLILAFSLASLASGAAMGLAADKVGRRALLPASSVPLLVLASLMALTSSAWTRNPLLFWSLFVPFSALANVFYLGEDTLKSEFWVTERRASFTAAVRALSLGATIPVIFLVAYLPVSAYLTMTAMVFTVGVVAAMAWYFMGAETGRGASIGAWDRA